MRYELDALRGDIAALSGLRDEVARVSELRGDLAALSGLRDEVARVAALRDDVAALMSLRQDLGQLAELRADMGRLRAELTEQLSSEMLVERIVMRTQASRMPAEPVRLDGGPGRALESSSWADDVPPRELTGGWPAIRLDEPRETAQFERGPRRARPVPAAGPGSERRRLPARRAPALGRAAAGRDPRRPARGRPPRRPPWPDSPRRPRRTGAPGTPWTSRPVRRRRRCRRSRRRRSPVRRRRRRRARPLVEPTPSWEPPPRGGPPRNRLRPPRSRRCAVLCSRARRCRRR